MTVQMRQPDPPSHRRLFIAASTVGIVGWMFILALLGYWYLSPVTLPSVTEPLPILNKDRTIAVGEPIVVRLDVVKTVPLDVERATRFIACESGNLITLTPSSTSGVGTLPVGTYTVISDNVILPNKVSEGDVCTMNFMVTYHINPVRDEMLALQSEPFTIAPLPDVDSTSDNEQAMAR